MDEYINREYAVDAVNDVYYNTPDIDLSCEKFEAAIRKIQASDVAQVRYGRWEYYDTYIDGITIFRCTCCGDLQSGRDGWGWKKNYCPNCGAKMNGGNDD